MPQIVPGGNPMNGNTRTRDSGAPFAYFGRLDYHRVYRIQHFAFIFPVKLGTFAFFSKRQAVSIS
jgi:hypothetical protein